MLSLYTTPPQALEPHRHAHAADGERSQRAARRRTRAREAELREPDAGGVRPLETTDGHFDINIINDSSIDMLLLLTSFVFLFAVPIIIIIIIIISIIVIVVAGPALGLGLWSPRVLLPHFAACCRSAS